METKGKLFGKIKAKQLMRDNSKDMEVVNVTDPKTYFKEDAKVNLTCPYMTHWNGTTCQNHTTVWKYFPEQGMAVFLV